MGMVKDDERRRDIVSQESAGIRIGLVGAGGIARSHFPAWKRLGARISVYSEAGAADLCRQFSGGSVVGDLDELIANSDIIDIVTPTYTHAEVARAALLAGRDVICEKPLAGSLEEAEDLVRLASREGRKLFPAHVVRYFPAYATMRQAVVDGVVGRPAVSRFQRTGEFPQWASWFGDDSLSGGVIMDLMVHDLDIARWVSGDVVSVHATLTEDESEAGTRVTVGQVVLTHRTDALSYVRGVWGPPGTSFRTSFNVAGDRGTLRYDSREDSGLVVDAGSRGAVSTIPDSDDSEETPYQSELADFLRSICTGSSTRVDAEDGIAAVRLALAARESARTGRTVEIDTPETGE